MYINFSDIPGNQNLFLDYLYEFENVSDFYTNDFRNKENFIKIFKKCAFFKSLKFFTIFFQFDQSL